MASMKENLNELKEELSKKKNESIKLSEKVQEQKNQEMYNTQNI